MRRLVIVVLLLSFAAPVRAIPPTINVTVLFAPASARIRPAGRELLEVMVKIMTDNPQLIVEIVGHSDDHECKIGEVALSQRRADAVYDYLVARGVDAARLKTTALGASPHVGRRGRVVTFEVGRPPPPRSP